MSAWFALFQSTRPRERDSSRPATASDVTTFQSTRPRERDADNPAGVTMRVMFQSTRPRERDTLGTGIHLKRLCVSIHSPARA